MLRCAGISRTRVREPPQQRHTHLGELDLAGAIRVDIVEHLLELGLRHLEAEGLESGLQLLEVDLPRAVRVEQVEGLLEFRLLLVGEATLLHALWHGCCDENGPARRGHSAAG